MSIREVSITGRNNVRALVTGQEELLTKVNSVDPNVNLPVTITSPLGQQNASDSVSTVLAVEQANVEISSFFQRYTAADDNAASAASSNTIISISFASVGTADARISYDGGTTYVLLKPGETLNLDAGGVMNYYYGSKLTWDTTTNAGSSLLIAINYI
jgi:hypothetical protein